MKLPQISSWHLCLSRCFTLSRIAISFFGVPFSSIKEGSLVTMKVTKGKVSTRKAKTEVSKPVEERKLGKRKAAVKADKSRVKLTKKAKLDKKDPNKPKRPPTAFFVFLEAFRKTYKEEHPNVKAVSAVGKAGGGKWKTLTAEKAPYEAKSAQMKSEYEKVMIAYNKKQESKDDDEDEASKSAVNDDDNDVESGEDEDDDD